MATERKTLEDHENDPVSTMTLADYEVDSNHLQSEKKQVPSN